MSNETTIPVPKGIRWPILRLTTPDGGGHSYWEIINKWTLPMVIRVNQALDLQAKATNLGVAKAQARVKEGQNGFR